MDPLVKESITSLTTAAQDVIRKITQPVDIDDTPFALQQRPDLMKLPCGAVVNIQISLPPDTTAPIEGNGIQHTSASAGLPTVLFLHGLGCDSTIWYPLLRASKLRDHFRVVTFDWPGCGESPFGTFIGVTPDGDPHERQKRDDQILREVIEYVGGQGDIYVVAHSLGVRVLERHLMSPKPAFKKALLISPNVPQNPSTLDATGYAATSMVFEQGKPFLRTLFLSYGFSPYSQENRTLAVDYIDAMASHPSTRQVLLQWMSCFAPPLDRSSLLQKAEDGVVKVTVVQGEDDHLIAPQGLADLDGSYGECKKVKYVKLKDVGHWSMVEDISGVVKEMKDLFGY